MTWWVVGIMNDRQRNGNCESLYGCGWSPSSQSEPLYISDTKFSSSQFNRRTPKWRIYLDIGWCVGNFLHLAWYGIQFDSFALNVCALFFFLLLRLPHLYMVLCFRILIMCLLWILILNATNRMVDTNILLSKLDK